MGPKVDKPNSSKKAVRAKKEQKIDDLTFGIKNKNKSSKVKLFIDRAEKCVKHSFGDIDAVRLPNNSRLVTWCLAHESVAMLRDTSSFSCLVSLHVISQDEIFNDYVE